MTANLTTTTGNLAGILVTAIGEPPANDQRRGADASQPSNFRSVMAESGAITFRAIVRDASPDRPGVYRVERTRGIVGYRDDADVLEHSPTGVMIDAMPDAGVDVASLKPGVAVNVLSSGDDFTFTLEP